MSIPPAPVVMGVLNVTADSFSDGGKYLDTDAAVAHGLQLRDDGVDYVDVGGESTRPGAARVDPAVEAARVTPVIEALVAEGVAVSVDTMRAAVAEAAIAAGASMVNDVSGGRADAKMAAVLAAAGVPWILMHWRSAGDGFVHGKRSSTYQNVVDEVSSELLIQVDAALAAGVDQSMLILDPGLGFAKGAEHNWQLLRALPSLVELGFPVLVGASRKRFLGTLLTDPSGAIRPPAGREVATSTISALAIAAGAWGVRVHDPLGSLDAIKVVTAWRSQS